MLDQILAGVSGLGTRDFSAMERRSERHCDNYCQSLRRRAPAMATALGQRGNAANGHHASTLRVGRSAPLDNVAPLGKDYGLYDAVCAILGGC